MTFTEQNVLYIRWINADRSKLDGFFLRLRLGKWEEGLGGTGYHVAYINGITKITTYSLNVKYA